MDYISSRLNGIFLKQILLDENNFAYLNASILNPLKTFHRARNVILNILMYEDRLILKNNNDLLEFQRFSGQSGDNGLTDSLESLDLSMNSLLRINLQV